MPAVIDPALSKFSNQGATFAPVSMVVYAFRPNGLSRDAMIAELSRLGVPPESFEISMEPKPSKGWVSGILTLAKLEQVARSSYVQQIHLERKKP